MQKTVKNGKQKTEKENLIIIKNCIHITFTEFKIHKK